MGLNAIYDILNEHNIYHDMFDVARIVDAQRGLLLEYTPQDGMRETQICCTDVFGSQERCKNCTSIRAFYSDKTVVKLEYAHGAVLLIFSVPVEHQGKRIVIELVKDISHSMTTDVKDKYREDEVTHIIDNLNKIATTDGLTGLYNRRFIDACLPDLVQNCHERNQPLCGAMLDIDDFKKVNDTHGHPVGDAVLASMGSTLSQMIRRGSDWVARYGGEEFFVCLVGVPYDNGRAILERTREKIAAAPVAVDGLLIPVTASVGMAQLMPGEDMQSLIDRCDKALYLAKKNGKNRIEG